MPFNCVYVISLYGINYIYSVFSYANKTDYTSGTNYYRTFVMTGNYEGETVPSIVQCISKEMQCN